MQDTQDEMVRFWKKLFYNPPKNWEELKRWCRINCPMNTPVVFSEVCIGCKAFQDTLERLDP